MDYNNTILSSLTYTNKRMTSKLQINEFNNSTNRIFLLFMALIQWFKFVLGIREKKPPLPPPPSQKDVYIEKQKQRFLKTFREEEADATNYNANIDAALKDPDPTVLAELMKIQDNELEKKWRSNVLIENTPRGNVIMFYDAYKRGFSYYCDNSVMPYDIMNAVAMKYVITFYCRDFFVDNNPSMVPISGYSSNPLLSYRESGVLPSSILPVSSSPSNENETQPRPEPNATAIAKANIPSNDTAFVKFKSYNTATKKIGVPAEKEKTINCFLHLGASRNWTPISKKARPNPINGFQTNMVSNNTVRTQTKGSNNMDSDSRQVLSNSEKKTLNDAKETETFKDIGPIPERETTQDFRNENGEDSNANAKVHVTKEKNKMSYSDYKKMHKLD